MRVNRRALMKQPLDPNWMPAVGDFVAVPSGATLCVKVLLVNKKFLLTERAYGRKRTRRVYHVSDVRPYPLIKRASHEQPPRLPR